MRVSLPEQVWLELKPAGFGSRSLAFILDAIFLGTLIVTIFILILFIAGVSTASFDVLWSILDDALFGDSKNTFRNLVAALLVFLPFFLQWAYRIFFEVRNHGVSPGKKLLGLRVVDEEGLPVTFRTSCIRNILLTVDLLPAFGMVGMVAMMISPRFQRVGDLAAGTLVIYEFNEVPQPRKHPASDTLPTHKLPLPLYTLIERFLDRRGEFTSDTQVYLEEKLLKVAKQLSDHSGEDLTLDELFQRSVPERHELRT